MSSNQTKTSIFRRSLAGIAAAATIAVSGLSFVSAEDAQAAGVKQIYIVQASTTDVATTATVTPKKR